MPEANVRAEAPFRPGSEASTTPRRNPTTLSRYEPPGRRTDPGAGVSPPRREPYVRGPVIRSGRTNSSNCASVSNSSSVAACRSVLPSLCAFFAILAALS